MQLKYYILLAQYILVSNRYEFVMSKPMIGEEIRIINPGEFNFIVSIKKINDTNPVPENDHMCTGSLISSRDILTIAHVFDIIDLPQIEVVVGSVDIRTGMKFRPEWYMTYEYWATMRNIPLNEINDISILRLKEEVPSTIKPILINPMSPAAISGCDLVIAGWGQNNERTISRRLKAAVTRAFTNSECQRRLRAVTGILGYVPRNMVCSAAQPFAVTTPGNSGSPVLYLGSLVAIHKAICPAMGIVYHSLQMNLHLAVEEFGEFILSVLNIP